MADNNSNIQKLYNAVSADYDVGSIGDFTKSLNDPANRQKLYNVVSKKYDAGDFGDFDKKITSELASSPDQFQPDNSAPKRVTLGSQIYPPEVNQPLQDFNQAAHKLYTGSTVGGLEQGITAAGHLLTAPFAIADRKIRESVDTPIMEIPTPFGNTPQGVVNAALDVAGLIPSAAGIGAGKVAGGITNAIAPFLRLVMSPQHVKDIQEQTPKMYEMVGSILGPGAVDALGDVPDNIRTARATDKAVALEKGLNKIHASTGSPLTDMNYEEHGQTAAPFIKQQEETNPSDVAKHKVRNAYANTAKAASAVYDKYMSPSIDRLASQGVTIDYSSSNDAARAAVNNLSVERNDPQAVDATEAWLKRLPSSENIKDADAYVKSLNKEVEPYFKKQDPVARMTYLKTHPEVAAQVAWLQNTQNLIADKGMEFGDPGIKTAAKMYGAVAAIRDQLKNAVGPAELEALQPKMQKLVRNIFHPRSAAGVAAGDALGFNLEKQIGRGMKAIRKNAPNPVPPSSPSTPEIKGLLNAPPEGYNMLGGQRYEPTGGPEGGSPPSEGAPGGITQEGMRKLADYLQSGSPISIPSEVNLPADATSANISGGSLQRVLPQNIPDLQNRFSASTTVSPEETRTVLPSEQQKIANIRNTPNENNTPVELGLHDRAFQTAVKKAKELNKNAGPEDVQWEPVRDEATGGIGYRATIGKNSTVVPNAEKMSREMAEQVARDQIKKQKSAKK